MDLFQILAGQLQAQQVGQRVGASPQQTQAALEAAVPLLLGALTRNAQQGQAGAIEQAVTQHDPRSLEQFAQGGALPDMSDGAKALGHIFGGQQQAAANAVGRRAGIDPQLALQILSIAAPLVLAYLNRQRQGQGGAVSQAPAGTDMTSVLTSVLGGLLGGQGSPFGQGSPVGQGGLPGNLGSQSAGSGSGSGLPPLPGQAPAQTGNVGGLLGTLNDVLDRDGDGSALDDLLGMMQRRG